VAQGDDSAGRRDLATLVAIARELDLLVDGLSEDRREGGRRAEGLEGDSLAAALRRELAAKALERVISFLLSPAVAAAHPDMLRLGLHAHLQDNLRALRELSAGAPDELFRLPPDRPKRVASIRDAEFRGRVAAIAELLVMHADPRDATDRRKAEDRACELVARGLRKVGYRTPRGSKSERGPAAITGKTVRAWLDVARRPTFKDEKLGEAFKGRVELGRHRKTLGESYGATAARMMALLEQDRPGAPLRALPLRGDPAPGK
jgi:hypothetical protein